MSRRFATADRHIRDTGVSYRAYGDTSERAWPLSHVPLLIEAGEWREIAQGIEQRARLLELVLADIYGEGRLIAAGDLPAAAVTGSPEFLHPLHGVKPPGGKFLHIYAADIGRGPDGRWWVLGDRSQAPSGAGYALANRLVLARAFPALYRDMNVERLAPFFEAFRFGLTSMAQRSNPRICLLTPGPFNETYFEQAYLARYLGLLLVEGGDLTMRDGKVHVRTIAGLKRADVIWRRIDSDFADPLELNAHSRLGVPGLIDALREGGVVIANALGSGVLEAPAMMSFMPKLCRTLLGEDLRLPNIATWWCGQGKARQSVIEDMDELAIAGAYGNPVPGFASSQPLIGAALSQEEKSRARHSHGRTRGGFCWPGGRQSFHDAGMARGPARAAAFRSARLCGAYAGGMENHARRVLPHLRPRRCARRVDGRRGPIGRRLGARRQAGRDGQFAAHRRDRPHPPHHGHLAEPGRG